MTRVRAVAGALVAVGAIDVATAESITGGFEAALAVRSLIDPRWPMIQPLARQRHQVSAPPSAGPMRVVPVSAVLRFRLDGRNAELHLLSLVQTSASTSLTAAVRLPAAGTRPAAGSGAARMQRIPPLVAHDDQGGSYQLEFGGRRTRTQWDGVLRIKPRPPEDICWLKIRPPAPAPKSRSVRIDLTLPPTPAEVTAAHSAGPGDRLLDLAAEELLAARLLPDSDGSSPEAARLADLAAALQAVGALENDSPALGRLVGLCRQVGIAPPTESARSADMPIAWLSLLADGLRQDGTSRAVPLAVLLPELDGARYALAGLVSSATEFTLHVRGTGRSPMQPTAWHRLMETGDPAGVQFSWWATDSAGRWHLGTVQTQTEPDGETTNWVSMTPPLHPEATSLEVILIGPSGRVTASMPAGFLRPAG